MIKKGHIFRLDEKEAVVMTKDFEFYKIYRSPDMIVLGQEISFTKSDIAKQKNKKMGFIKYGALVSSVAAIFVVLLLTFFPLNTDKNGNV